MKNSLFKFRKVNFGLILLIIFNVQTSGWGAGVFRIVNRSYGNVSSNSSLVTQIDQLFDAMETEVNNQLTQFDAGSYLTGTANSTALSSSGGTHDVAQRFKYFYVEVGGGLAADLNGKGPEVLTKNSSSTTEVKGLSGAMNLTIGANGSLIQLPKLGDFNPEKFKMYLSYSQFARSIDSVSFNYLSYSIIGQYHFLESRSFLLGTFKWNGIDFSTGYKYNKIKILYSQSFSETTQQTISDPSIGGSQNMTMSYSATVQLGASAAVSTIPIEVSTSVGVLYIFDLFAGLGVDLNFGSASSIISSPGTVSATEPSGLAGTMSGDIQFDLGQKTSPQFINSRYLVGVAFDFRVLSFQVQYNRNLSNHAESIHLGLGAHF